VNDHLLKRATSIDSNLQVLGLLFGAAGVKKHLLWFSVMFSAMVLALPISARASIILDPPPELLANSVLIEYDAASQLFGANGIATELDDDGSGPPLAITGGGFALNVIIDNIGSLVGGVPGDDLVITGTANGFGGVLLTGEVFDFMTPNPSGDPLEFLFVLTGGVLAPLFIGTDIGIILTGTDFPGSFTSDFANNSDGIATVAPGSALTVPEPTTLVLLSLGLAGLGFTRRKSKA
jgi:hypothetical protein